MKESEDGHATLQLLAAIVMVAYLSTSRVEQDSPLLYTYPQVSRNVTQVVTLLDEGVTHT